MPSRNLARLLGLVAIALATALPARAQDLPTLIARVSPAVAVIAEDGSHRASGFVASRDGLVVTSLHVVARMKRPRVTLSDGRVFDDPGIVAWDGDRDLAVLKVPARNLRALALATTGSVKVGQRVVAFGAPWGLSGTATQGIVSAIRRHPKLEGAALLQTDAAINPGNSGGPLVNASGQVVGIVASLVPQAQNLGFAVPADELRSLLRARHAPITPEALRGRLLESAWAGSVLQKRWRSDEDGRAAVYELEPGDGGFTLVALRADAESWLGRRLALTLRRAEGVHAGESAGDLQCETLKESRRLPWRHDGAQVLELGLDRIELRYLAPALPDPQGDCRLEFTEQRLRLVPATDTDLPAASGEDARAESIRAQRTAYLQRRERLRRECPEVRAKLARDCSERTPWNASSCGTFGDLAAVCAREGF